MKTQLNHPKNQIRRPSFKLFAFLACLCVATGLFLPAIKTSLRHHHALPAGQLRADARTIIAGVRYLFTPETDRVKVATRYYDNLATLGQPSNSRTLEVFPAFSDQTKALPKASTNPPAQS